MNWSSILPRWHLANRMWRNMQCASCQSQQRVSRKYQISSRKAEDLSRMKNGHETRGSRSRLGLKQNCPALTRFVSLPLLVDVPCRMHIYVAGQRKNNASHTPSEQSHSQSRKQLSGLQLPDRDCQFQARSRSQSTLAPSLILSQTGTDPSRRWPLDKPRRLAAILSKADRPNQHWREIKASEQQPQRRMRSPAMLCRPRRISTRAGAPPACFSHKI